MPQYTSLSLSDKRVYAAMPSVAALSRIPVHVNDSVVPAAASQSSVNAAVDIAPLFSAMSIREPTVKATSASLPTSNASKSKLTLTATSASKGCPPLRQHQQRSLDKIAPTANSESVSRRIAERRQRVVANLAPGSKRPAPPVKVTPTSPVKPSTSSRVITTSPAVVAVPVADMPAAVPAAVVPAVAPAAVPIAVPAAVPATVPAADIPTAVPRPRQYGWLTVTMPDNYRQETPGKCGHIERIVQISDQVWETGSLIPSTSTSRKRRPQLLGRFRPAVIPLTRTPIPHHLSPVFLPHTVTQLPRHFAQVYLTRRAKQTRGTERYCPAIPRSGAGRGKYGWGLLYKGRSCDCCSQDGDAPLGEFNIPPKEWSTTPVESGVDPHPPVRKKPPRKVRFADDLTHTFAKPRDPAASFVYKGTSKDTTRIEDDFPEGFPFYEDMCKPQRRRR